MTVVVVYPIAPHANRVSSSVLDTSLPATRKTRPRLTWARTDDQLARARETGIVESQQPYEVPMKRCIVDIGR